MTKEITPTTENSEQANSIKVMIVDDSMIVRKILRKLLNRAGVDQVIECKAFAEAEASVGEVRPDVIALDVILPDVMDVGKAISRLCYRADLPIVMLSSRSDEGMAVTLQCLYGQAVDFIGKPQSGEQMKAMETRGTWVAEQIKRAARFCPRRLSRLNNLNVVPETDRAMLPENHAKKMIVIGGAVGSYPLLLYIMSHLKKTPETAVVVAQYMADEHVDIFLEQVRKYCHLPLDRARSGEPLRENHIYLVAFPEHCVRFAVHGDKIFSVVKPNPNMEEDVDFCETFAATVESAAGACGKRMMALVFPGIGPGLDKAVESVRQHQGRLLVLDQWVSTLSSPLPAWATAVPQIDRKNLQEALAQFVGSDLDLNTQRQIAASLKKIPILSELSIDSLIEIIPQLQVRKYAQGDVVINKGDVGCNFYIICEGQVDVIGEEMGEETLIATLPAGECFGEMSLLSGDPVSATIRVSTPSIIVAMNAVSFHRLIEKSPVLAARFTRLLANRVKRANQRMAEGVTSGMAGKLEAIRFPELVQTLSAMDGSGILQLKDENRQGRVYFTNGAIVDAESQDQGQISQGEAGFYNLLTWERGSFRFEPKAVDRRRVIMLDTLGLLLEGMRRLDEQTWMT